MVASLFWILGAAAIVWALLRSFGKDESADTLLPVVFAVILLMISQVASLQADRDRKKHQDRIEGLLSEIRDALKKSSDTHEEDDCDKECGE